MKIEHEERPMPELRLEWEHVRFVPNNAAVWRMKDIDGYDLGAIHLYGTGPAFYGAEPLSLAQARDILAFMEQLKERNTDGNM